MNNQIRLPNDEINFTNDVGLTGQPHDDYAEPGTLTRYDWMRMLCLGLLAQQASAEEPENFRPGTMWFKLSDFFYKCVKNGNFVELAECLKILSGSDSKSLSEWSEEINEKIDRFTLTGTFSGVVHDDALVISIPRQLQAMSVSPNRPYLFKNGLLVDPSLVRFNDGCPVAIELSGTATLTSEDTFTVFIKQ
jgi:hypothetical protein